MNQDKNQKTDKQQNQESENQQGPLPSGMDQNIIAAHEQAEADIDNDPEFSAHSPNDDLDEGETARLGEDNTGLV